MPGFFQRMRPRTRSLALALALVGLVVACAIDSRSSTPVQEWYAGEGPVIRHDSFPSDCTLCHEGEDWHTIRKDFQFDHLAETGYALEGAHAAAQCLRCHNDRGPVEQFALRGCAGCHEDPHRSQLGEGCLDCHDQGNWRPKEQIAKHMEYGFPLVGAHAAAACWRCHEGAQVGNFTRTSSLCVECHRDDLAGATEPDHVAEGWVQDCDECHIPTSWNGAGFKHPWPLTGKHRTIDCSDCHVGGVFAGTPDQCVDCHMSEYQGVKDPDHVAMNFPTACQQCHGTTTWEGAHFNHSGITSGCVDCHLDDYQGAKDPDHVALNFSTECQQCHSTNTWDGAHFDHTGISSGCVDCHLSDYQGAKNPDHVALGISQECQQCHSTNTWSGATFDHTGIVDNCVQCHLPEYQSTNNPNHQAAGFPTSCEDCHTTNHWTPATFDHDFPITTGKHKGLQCTECHTTPSNYAVFSCIDCHEHNQSKMAGEHKEVNNYVWSSPACYDCHPKGKGD